VFFYFIYFTWRLTTLQYCSGFCYTLTWISHGCTCVPHPESPPTSLPIAALRVVRVHLPWAPCLMHWTWTGDLFHIWQYTCFTIIFSQIIPPLPSPTESKNLFFTSGSFAVSHMGSSFHLSKFHQIRSVAESCPTLCDPMNRSTPGLLVHHQLPEFTQTHVHRVSDAIQQGVNKYQYKQWTEPHRWKEPGGQRWNDSVLSILVSKWPTCFPLEPTFFCKNQR